MKTPEFTQPLDLKKGRVEMVHGAGGKAMSQLIEHLFIQRFDNPALNQQNDQATLELGSGRIVMATDSPIRLRSSVVFLPLNPEGLATVWRRGGYWPFGRDPSG